MSEYVVGCSSHNVQAQLREELIYCTILDLQVENWIFTVFLRALKTRTESGVFIVKQLHHIKSISQMSEYVVGCSSHNVQAQHREELIYCTITWSPVNKQVENWIFTVFLRALKTRTESGVLVTSY